MSIQFPNLGITLDYVGKSVYIFGFEIIEVLLYAMRLKAVGIEDRKIQDIFQRISGSIERSKPY